MTKYITITEARGDRWEHVSDTLDEANACAHSEWNHLTASEQKQQHVYVVLVTEQHLDEDATVEDGTIDWRMFNNHDIPDGAFDSARL